MRTSRIAHGLESLDGFAHRRAADTQLLGDLVFGGNAAARFEPAFGNALLDEFQHDLDSGRFLGRLRTFDDLGCLLLGRADHMAFPV